MAQWKFAGGSMDEGKETVFILLLFRFRSGRERGINHGWARMSTDGEVRKAHELGIDSRKDVKGTNQNPEPNI